VNVPGYSEERKMVRLALVETEHKLVRLAAAAEGVSMAEFCRQAALERARQTSIKPPAAPSPPRKGKKK
jgi:uncharacterized protein (DUF1778 family)